MPRATAAPPATASEPPSQKSFCTSTMMSARTIPTVSCDSCEAGNRLLEPQACLGDYSPTSAAVPPVILRSSSKDVGNTVCGCPAAAHTTSYFASQVSTRVRMGVGCATGPTPPIAWPVQVRTEFASARATTTAPTRDATREVSTRCAPLVITSSGAPSAANTRLFAIAPTSQPSCLAAAAAVGAGSGSSRTSPVTPSDVSTPANPEKSTAMPITLPAPHTQPRSIFRVPPGLRGPRSAVLALVGVENGGDGGVAARELQRVGGQFRQGGLVP